jgi:hypothetical protein
MVRSRGSACKRIRVMVREEIIVCGGERVMALEGNASDVTSNSHGVIEQPSWCYRVTAIALEWCYRVTAIVSESKSDCIGQP